MPEQPRLVLSGWCRLCGPQAGLSGESLLHAPASGAHNSVHLLQIMFAPLLRMALGCCQAALLQLPGCSAPAAPAPASATSAMSLLLSSTWCCTAEALRADCQLPVMLSCLSSPVQDLYTAAPAPVGLEYFDAADYVYTQGTAPSLGTLLLNGVALPSAGT